MRVGTQTLVPTHDRCHGRYSRAPRGPVPSNALVESSRGCPVERRTPKKVVVSKAAVKRSGMRAVKASAKLEGRVVPANHQRSAAVEAYLAKQQPPKR